jgi:hypothetical protein
LSAEVMALQFELRKNIGRLPSEALRFGESARNLLAILRGAVRDLYSLHEADALARLSRCEPIAQEMAATAAATPVDSFEALC